MLNGTMKHCLRGCNALMVSGSQALTPCGSTAQQWFIASLALRLRVFLVND